MFFVLIATENFTIWGNRMDKRTKEFKSMSIEKTVYHCVLCNRDFIGTIKPNDCPICKNTDCIVINTSLIISK
jgi:rubrerythrin